MMPMFKSNPRYMIRAIATILKVSQERVHLHLEKLGYVHKLDIWITLEFKKRCWPRLLISTICCRNVRKTILFTKDNWWWEANRLREWPKPRLPRLPYILYMYMNTIENLFRRHSILLSVSFYHHKLLWKTAFLYSLLDKTNSGW